MRNYATGSSSWDGEVWLQLSKGVWEYDDSNEYNWSNRARECYPILVSIPELIYLVFSRNIKIFLETSRFLSKYQGFSRNMRVSLKTSRFLLKNQGFYQNQLHWLYSYLYSNCLTFFVSIKVGECQPEMNMLYSNHLTSFVSINICECQLEMTMSIFLLSFVCSRLVLFYISQLNYTLIHTSPAYFDTLLNKL